MTLISTRRLARLGTAAALALLLASPSAAETIEIDLNSDNFESPLANPFFPLEPATYIYKAETEDGCEINVVEVTTDTETITVPGNDPIQAVVVEDAAYETESCESFSQDDLVEFTFDWFLNDEAGNVWYFGENSYDCTGPYPAECELNDGSWKAGEDFQGTGTNAEPGIVMLGEPNSGDRYRQELYEGFAEDWGKVMNLDAAVLLRRDDAFSPGEFDGCIVTKEWNDLESGAIEQKTFCEGIGLVLVEEHSGKVVRLELTSYSSLAATAGADAFTFRVPGKN